MRMGCLQASVYVSPNDIRPDYDDLVNGVGLDAYAYLFEAQTVLGQKPREIVAGAWDFTRLMRAQNHYCGIAEQNLERLRRNSCATESLLDLARAEGEAYLSVMDPDPLLPRKLWPAGYCGPEVYRLHKELTGEIRCRL
jgi:DNA-binding transcriptional regulator PaaX